MTRGSIRQRFSVVFALLILLPALALGLVTVRLVHTSTVAQVEHQQLITLQAIKSNVVDRHVAVAILDIDHSKEINDSFGHGVGDEVLRRIARVVQASFGGDAEVGRYGGEEFMALLPGRATSEAVQEVERVRVALECQRWRERTLVVTVSAGVAFYDAGEEVDRLIERADRALYRAKASGRNRVIAG